MNDELKRGRWVFGFQFIVHRSDFRVSSSSLILFSAPRPW
jgi:hypothetical protein